MEICAVLTDWYYEVRCVSILQNYVTCEYMMGNGVDVR